MPRPYMTAEQIISTAHDQGLDPIEYTGALADGYGWDDDMTDEATEAVARTLARQPLEPSTFAALAALADALDDLEQHRADDAEHPYTNSQATTLAALTLATSAHTYRHNPDAEHNPNDAAQEMTQHPNPIIQALGDALTHGLAVLEQMSEVDLDALLEDDAPDDDRDHPGGEDAHLDQQYEARYDTY